MSHITKKGIPAALCALLLAAGCTQAPSGSPDIAINDLEYFETRGVNFLVFNNTFSGGFNDEKDAGIELIHYGVRTAQGGAIRLNNTPEQWDLVPNTTSRTVNREDNSIEVGLRFPDYDFDARVQVKGMGKAVEIAVFLDHPLPEALIGHAGFNLEFLPSQYWAKTYLVDGRAGRFPRYAVSSTVTRPNAEKIKQYKGYKTYDDRGTDQFVDPLPLAIGHQFLLAPDEPQRMVSITSDNEISLYDGRMVAQNGWFTFRTLLPAGQTGKVVSWMVEANSIPGWIREPNIGYCQVGYIPDQPKVAVIELDKNDTPLPQASIWKVAADGSHTQVFSGDISVWGPYFKYNYVKFDFSQVTEPGIYYIQYGDFNTGNFIIGDDVYDHITDATSDVWIPIHMNHIKVNEGYRVWHGEPFREGYLQAPNPTDHFDLHSQGASTDTKYKALELIPGLNVGGYFDAGDFDIETGSNISVVQNLVSIWERFHPDRDETFVDEDQRYVDLHRPDGKPDILQFIEHGLLNLVAQAENIGHMSQTLSNSVLWNYHHLGDAAAITDGLHYDPRLKPYEISADGKSSGTPDDMWAFTGRNTSSDMRAANMFAGAAHALRGYNDALAGRALKNAERLRREVSELQAARRSRGGFGGFSGGNDMGTNLQMYIATGGQSYLDQFKEQIARSLQGGGTGSLGTAIQAIPYMDAGFKESLRPNVEKYKEYIAGLDTLNPYGVPIGLGNWAGSGNVVSLGATICQISKEFPDIISKNEVYRAVNFLFGCHPYHNYSLVAAVGAARPKEVFYGNNRADFAAIPGNVAPGLLFRQPDHFENYDDWPFLWGQNEGTISGNVSYLTFGLAFKDLIGRP